MSWSLVIEHIFLVLASGLLAILIGLPLGIVSYLAPKARKVILWIVDILQTIPSLALLGIIMVFVGAGKLTVIIGITLYSLLPIVRNTYVGLSEVDSGVKEAAQGMGMKRLYQTMFVEFPLAFPTVFAGIRIAIINAIGTAVFAAFVGGGGLGAVINRGIRIQKMSLILGGTAALMAIAIAADVLMGMFERSTRRNRGTSRRLLIITLVVVLALFGVITPFVGFNTPSDDTLLMYEGAYTEIQIMDRMAKFLIEDQSDLTVTIMDQMSHVNSFKALIGDNHTCDLIFSYDGSLLVTFLGLDPTDVPEDETLYDFANRLGEEEFGVRLLDKIGFNNTYAIAVTQEVADEYGVTKISDLAPIAENLVFGAEHEYFTLEGSTKYGPFCEFYGLNFKDSVSVDLNLKYAAAEARSFDVTEVYATDGLNRKAQLVVLEDDLNFFPEYNGAYLVREDTLTRFSDVPIEDILNELGGMISNEDMVQMTYDVDVLGLDIDEVTRNFLVSIGLLDE